MNIDQYAHYAQVATGEVHRLAAQLAERDAEIAQLKAQVAELQAWKDAVPMFAIAQVAREPELASWDPIQEMRDWLVPLGYD